MKKFHAILSLLFLILVSNVRADNIVKPFMRDTNSAINFERIKTNKELFLVLQNDSVLVNDVTKKVKFQRGKAIIFTIFTGLLGGHRIYLGTHQRTPIIYAVTLGGLGILPLIDLVEIIFTKDLSKFEYRPQIIMWGK